MRPLLAEPDHAPDDRAAAGGTALHALLEALDPDRERAAHKYEDLRHRLVVFFCARRAPAAEDQADETIDRLARRIAEGAPIRELGRFAYGVARLVLREGHRRERRRRDLLERDARDARRPTTPFDSDAGIDCLRHCIQRLEPRERELILAYYGGDGREGQHERRDLAGRLGISASALRLRAHRIRQELEACARRCLAVGRTAGRAPAREPDAR